MAFKNRIHLPFHLRQPQFPIESEGFTRFDGSVINTRTRIRKVYQGVTDYMPESIHQALVIALAHDSVTIEGERYLGQINREGEYNINWQGEVIGYPVAPASFQAQVTPFDAQNTNCGTCAELTQLGLQDDNFYLPLLEGTTGNLNAFDNDSICCAPSTPAIVWYNTSYVQSATIDAAGNVAITLLPTVATTAGVKLATYRVTCEGGAYDEADIYGDVEGTDTACLPPSDLVYSHVNESELTNEQDEIAFSLSPSAPASYEWQLYDAGDLGTPLQTGSTAGSPIVFFPALEPGASFIISVRSVCGPGDYSEWINFPFVTPAPATMCGRFLVAADDGTADRVAYNYTYMNCNGEMINRAITNTQDTVICMLVDSGNVPVYFVADPPINYNYTEPC